MSTQAITISFAAFFAISPTVYAQNINPTVKGEYRAVKSANSDSISLLKAQTKLASALLKQIEPKRATGENIVISPASLGMALAVIDLGADNTFKAAIRKALGFDTRTVDRFKQHRDELQGLRNAVKKLQSEKNLFGVVETANAIFIDPTSGFVRPVVDKITKSGAIVFSESPLTPGLVAHINDWFSATTQGLIPSILDRVPAEAELVALNAIYFKDRWRVRFESSRTRHLPFQHVDGSVQDAAMMAGTMDDLLVRDDQTFVAVDLRYVHDRFSLVVATTRDSDSISRADHAAPGRATPPPVHGNGPRLAR